MAFRMRDENPVYLDNDGNPCAGGSLTFTRTGTGTALNVFSAPDLLTSLGNVITLNSSGRSANDLWLDDSTYQYRVVLKKSDGTTVWTKDYARLHDPAGIDVPDPNLATDGQVLGSDGTTWEWVTPRFLPDLTGHAGKKLVNLDGETAGWQADSVYDEDNLPGGIENSDGATGYITVGNTMIQWGNGTCPANGSGLTSTVAVTFGVAFGGTPHAIIVTSKSTAVSSNTPSGSPSMQATSHTSTGFTANAFVGEENTGGTDVLSGVTNFTYVAIGPAP